MTRRPAKRPTGPSLFDDVPEEQSSFVEMVGKPEPASTFVERVKQTPEPVPEVVRGPPISSGEKGKARDILAAIRTLHQVEQRGTPATPSECSALRKFCGFGPVALSIFPNPVTGVYKDESWRPIGEALKELLTPDEYDSAKRTTFNAFYTSPTVISAMHSALDRLGVPDGAVVLEPGAGIGNFLRPGKRFIGVEQDSISGRIAKALHPDQDIRIEDFQRSKLPQLDAVIGNVPFADLKLDHHGQKFALHDYFFAKSVDSLKPGGVLALVTSHYTLDKQNAAIREYLGDRADFLGAIRLPSDAFKREGTAVVTDIVFLRKRGAGEPARHSDPEWLKAEPIEIDGRSLPINHYFKTHPEMVLGTYSGKDSLYGEGYSVTSNGDLKTQLLGAVERLPECVKKPAAIEHDSDSRSNHEHVFVPPPPERHISEGSFFVHDGRIHQLIDGQSSPVVYGGGELWANGGLVGRRLGHLIELRDKARYVLRSQNEGWPESARNDARRKLNLAYDIFKSAYGPINKTTFSETKDETTIRRMPNLVKFREDPDAMLVMALEEYDEETGEAKKAPIMLKDVVGKTPPITTVTSAEEGLLVSLDHRGTVDLPYIARLYGKPEEQVIAELGDLIYLDPESKHWETADAYLSGNVRAKLAAAEKAGITRNIEALKAVQPEDVLPGDIDANLGAPWIPASDIQAFAADLFHVDSDSVTVGHLAKDAVWSVQGDWSAERSVAVTSDYGTPRASVDVPFACLLRLLNPFILACFACPGPSVNVVLARTADAQLALTVVERSVKDVVNDHAFWSVHYNDMQVFELSHHPKSALPPGSHEVPLVGRKPVHVLSIHQHLMVNREQLGKAVQQAHCASVVLIRRWRLAKSGWRNDSPRNAFRLWRRIPFLHVLNEVFKTGFSHASSFRCWLEALNAVIRSGRGFVFCATIRDLAQPFRSPRIHDSNFPAIPRRSLTSNGGWGTGRSVRGRDGKGGDEDHLGVQQASCSQAVCMQCPYLENLSMNSASSDASSADSVIMPARPNGNNGLRSGAQMYQPGRGCCLAFLSRPKMMSTA